MNKEINPEYPRAHDTLKNQKRVAGSSGNEKEEYDPEATNLNVDFEKLLQVRNELLLRPSMEPEAIEAALDKLKNQQSQFDEVYDRTLQRIKTETGYLHEYEDAGIYALLLDGFIGKKIPGVREIRWGRSYLKGRETAGMYIPYLRSIDMASAAPTKLDILKAIASSGLMPDEIDVLIHEFAHSTQHLISGERGLRDIQELKEAHAYASMGYGTPRIMLVEILQDYKKRPGGENITLDKAIGAVNVIDRLRALGFKSHEIGRMIGQHGEWDKKSANYPEIQKIIDRKLAELGIDEYDLENLVQAHKIEIFIDLLRAMHIAQEEIQKAVDTLR